MNVVSTQEEWNAFIEDKRCELIELFLREYPESNPNLPIISFEADRNMEIRSIHTEIFWMAHNTKYEFSKPTNV